MTADLDGIAYAYVVTLEAFEEDGLRVRRLERPRGRLTLRVLDVEMHDRVRGDEDDLLDDAFHNRPFGNVVVAVGMMGTDRRCQTDSTDERDAEGLERHDPVSYTHLR